MIWGRLGRTAMVAVVLWTLPLSASAQVPDYDAFSDKDGNITTGQHGQGLIALLQKSGQLETVYADAVGGNPRAKRVFDVLETDYFPDVGRQLAERVSRPPCLVPVLRELSGWCVPDWTFLDFLSKDEPGGTRLRKAFFDGFAERAHQRGLENQLILSVMNALLGAGVAATVMREAGAAGSVAKLPVVPGQAIKGRVGLDTNTLIARLEGTQHDVQAVVRAIAGRNPSVSITAVKEFLRGGGDPNALRSFLIEAGGSVGKAASPGLLKQLRDLGLKQADARIVGSAVEEGIPLLTRDKAILRKVPDVAGGY